MAYKTITVSNTATVSNGEIAVLQGKNGFNTILGQIPVRVISASEINTSSNIRLVVSNLDNLVDTNFTDHVLNVNDIQLGGIRGDDYISIPVKEKTDTGSGLDFVGYNTNLSEYSANILNFSSSGGYIDIPNLSSGGLTLYDKLPTTPFLATLGQILDISQFSDRAVYVKGSRFNFIKTQNIKGETGSYQFDLGVAPLGKSFVTVKVDEQDTSFSLSGNTITVSLSGQEDLLRTIVDYYTVPAIEIGDNVMTTASNTYGITDTSYNPSSARYNVALTANNFYVVYFKNDLKANIAGAIATNISRDLVGIVNNVDSAANTFTLDYQSASYPGVFELGGKKIYNIQTSLSFTPLDLGRYRTLKDVDIGPNVIRARNKNSFGRRSPYVTRTEIIKELPIQKVQNVTLEEFLYKDTTQGIVTRLEISWDHITGQDVTDYELSYKINFEDGSATTFNTVKLSAAGMDSSGKIQYTINNIERGRAASVNNIRIRITAMNKTIKGLPYEVVQSIIGKTALPQNVENLFGGQQGSSLILGWRIPTNADGTVVDIDLNEIVLRRVPGTVNTASFATEWTNSSLVARIPTPATDIILSLKDYGTYTYLVKTRDTSGNYSNDVVGISITQTRPADLSAYQAWSESDPSSNVITGQYNENTDEYYYPSFANSVTGGLSVAGGNPVDNANGASSGWSVIGGAPTDLILSGDTGIYQTQLRDIGQTVTGTIVLDIAGIPSTTTTFNDLKTNILTGVSEVSGSSTILRDTDYGGLGHILGYSNATAAAVSYSSTHRTLVSGGSSGNVYAIWNEGQFAGDVSNANSWSLIAGVINADAISLGESFYANGRISGSNSMANLTTVSSSYVLVDLLQFTDTDASSLTFSGLQDAIITATKIRFAQTDPYYANGNIDISKFIASGSSDGYGSYVAAEKTFRWYQVRFEVTSTDTASTSYIFDKLEATLDLKDRTYTNTITITTSPQTIDYSSMNFLQTPHITLTMLSEGPNIPIIATLNTNTVDINVYSNTGELVTSVDVQVVATGA